MDSPRDSKMARRSSKLPNKTSRMMLGLVAMFITVVSAAGEDIFSLDQRVVVTQQAMGARAAVAADFDGKSFLKQKQFRH